MLPFSRTFLAAACLLTLSASFAAASGRHTLSSCDRALLTLLSPAISRELNLYYAKQAPQIGSVLFAPYLNGSRVIIKEEPSYLSVTVIVEPYVGPHVSIGEDSLSFRIDNAGAIQLTDYKHLKSYKLPPHLKGQYQGRINLAN